jgi:hypothetical protein
LGETFRITPMDDEQDRLAIEEFAELVGLSIPQSGALRRPFQVVAGSCRLVGTRAGVTT